MGYIIGGGVIKSDLADPYLVRCEVCGFVCKRLTPHLKNVHNLSGKEYKSLFPNSIIQHNCNKGLTNIRYSC